MRYDHLNFDLLKEIFKEIFKNALILVAWLNVLRQATRTSLNIINPRTVNHKLKKVDWFLLKGLHSKAMYMNIDSSFL